MHDTIVVFCKSSSLSGLIARTLRYRQVYSLPLPPESAPEEVLSLSPRGAVIAGGAQDVPEALVRALLQAGVPVLALGCAAAGVCRCFGGQCADEAPVRGAVTLSLSESPLFEDVESGERVLHCLCEMTLPEGASVLATATERPIGFALSDLPLYALQYPVERNDPDAAQMLCNFAVSLCGCARTWDEDAIIDQAVERIRASAPEGRVLCAVSGGVDSAVCARLASLAVGDRLICVFVDTGLFRSDEPDMVISTFMETMGLVVAHVDASEAFMQALCGVTDFKTKERVASELMTRVLRKQLSFDPAIRTIVMGANLSDTLFGFSPSEAHQRADGETVILCAPICDLFKEEVRRLAKALSLPDSVAERQPFPASGLALRVYGQVTEERLQILRKADRIFREEICAGGFEKRLWQYYATLVDSPDNPGGYAICLRALQASQGGATSARLPFDVLERAAERIRRELPEATRVVYDLTPSAHYGELE